MVEPTLIVAFLAAYLAGSLSSAILVSHAFGLPDPRTDGSKNPGATNVLRLGGKLPAMLTLLGDAAKGFGPVLICMQFDVLRPWAGMVGLAAFLGHLFPLFFGFKGGKGVATLIGASFALNWQLGLGFCLIWALVAFLTRYSSLAALVASSALPFIAWQLKLHHFIWPLSVMVILLLYRHGSNIQKLLTGTESRIGKK